MGDAGKRLREGQAHRRKATERLRAHAAQLANERATESRSPGDVGPPLTASPGENTEKKGSA